MAYGNGSSAEGKEKSVLELARDGEEPPHSYVCSEEDRPLDASSPTSPIPHVDLQLLFSSGPSKESEMEKLRSTLDSWGFFQAINHGISSSLLEKVISVGREFFHLSKEERQKFSKRAYGKEEDGLETIPQNGPQDQILDWNDQLYLQVIPEDARKLDDWPENPNSFRDILHEYTMEINDVIHLVLRAMANLVGLEEDYFVRQFGDKATAHARFNYYPPCSRPDLVLGIKSHSDGSGITILLPDPGVDGFEVLKDNQWFRIHPIRHALLINVGDQIEIMSNGIFKSPVHRAVTNLEKERISLAMFLAAEVDKEIGPANSLVNTSRPRLYKNIKVKDYLDMFLLNFLEGKRSIDFVKV
ncbi:hypothetical protein MRB53_017949 [Persea americana]|uniref:Uncharacterized protein n=1 Tax=Persea americana TaxID=3435 RepID=A0ACC2M6H4_PERAE|nr:hypothetical protein MRB53_017949 [Persea americana]